MTAAYSRRSLFRGAKSARPIRRPPWTGDDFTDSCTRCDDCLSACPEQLLFRGDGGFPEIDFGQSGCDFCGECARACEAQTPFDLKRSPFAWRAVLDESCLAFANIDCQSCRDACEPLAITFRPTLHRAPQPQVSSDACTGCGACLSVCPAQAIKLEVTHV